MPQYEPYPKKADTPSRKTRKSERNKVFQHNKRAAKVAKEASRRVEE